MTSRPLFATAALAIALSFLADLAPAQQVRVYDSAEAIDPQDVARILAPETAAPAAADSLIGLGKSRSLKLLDDPAAAPGSAPVSTQVAVANVTNVSTGSAAAAPRTQALALKIQFALDSIELAPAAKPQLDALAAGIRMLPDDKKIVIEGHTDARGADFYNDALSRKRAAVVKRYLVAAQGIDASRLRAIGMGPYEPLPGHTPTDAENRRVQFRGE